jgi:hypothetical protein
MVVRWIALFESVPFAIGERYDDIEVELQHTALGGEREVYTAIVTSPRGDAIYAGETDNR